MQPVRSNLIDRLVHRCEVISIEGESYRLREARARRVQGGAASPYTHQTRQGITGRRGASAPRIGHPLQARRSYCPPTGRPSKPPRSSRSMMSCASDQARSWSCCISNSVCTLVSRVRACEAISQPAKTLSWTRFSWVCSTLAVRRLRRSSRNVIRRQPQSHGGPPWKSGCSANLERWRAGPIVAKAMAWLSVWATLQHMSAAGSS